MAFDFQGWPDEKQKDDKPVNRLMPFHRIRVPATRIVEPGGPAPAQRLQKVITGDGYSVGARSTKDYDAKFGEDLGKDLADLVKNVFPPLRAASLIVVGVSTALAALIRLVPGGGSLADTIDGFDPLVKLFQFIGSNVDALLVDSLIRSVPAWVPVFDETLFPNNQFTEVDGILIRSFQKIDSNPFWQWHRWYDWHFAVGVSPVFQQMVGFGNEHRDDDNTMGLPNGVNLQNYHKDGLPKGGGLSAALIADCDWDIGALGLRSGPVRTGPNNEDRMPLFFDQLQPRVKHDWCWPMAGMFFWAMGRSVYDCTHATKDNARRTKVKDRRLGQRLSDTDRQNRGVHVNQINPPKAIATARWEAFKFKENPKETPAIQFMFYANTHLSSAGFFDKNNPHRPGFPPLNTDNFEFIIDLPPPVVTAKTEYAIGHTPEFAQNTLVLQPRLVFDANFDPFQKDGSGSADGVVEDSNDRTSNDLTTARGPRPTVELFGLKPGEPPRQALIRIPLRNNISNNINAYGVLLSIGWLDPDSVSAPKVKKVSVTLVAIEATQPDSDSDWNINVGVNGRWFLFRFNASKAPKSATGTPRVDLASISGGQPIKIDMLLAEDDFIMVSAHGFEEDPFDGVMRLLPEFPIPQTRPNKKAPSLPSPTEALDDPSKIGKFKADTLARLKVLDDRLLRHSADVKVPTSKPDATGNVKTTTIAVPMVGDEIDWTKDVDTDDDHQASLTARAMFLRLAIGNRFDANDVLGMFDANMRDPFSLDPANGVRRSQDGTDTENPIVVKDLIKAPGLGKTRKCQISAYKSEVVGRMGAMGYDPNKVEYTLFFDVTVDDLPATP